MRVKGSTLLVAAALATPLLALVAVLATSSWVQALVLWPTGLVTATAVLAPPRWRLPVVAAGGLVAGSTFWLVDVPHGAALGFGAATTAQAFLAQLVLCRGWRGPRPGLRDQHDMGRWILASFAGAALGTTVLGVVVTVDGWRFDLGQVVMVLLAGVFSQLLLVLPFLELDAAAPGVSQLERGGQWVATVASTAAAFGIQDSAYWAFLTVPFLAWGALRLPLREMVLQLLVITVTVLTLGSVGIGPLGFDQAGDAAVETATVLHLFLIGGVLLVVPYALVSQQLRRRSAEAHREGELVRRIMDSATRTAIIATDRAGRITLVNVGAENLLGYRGDELLGRTPEVIVPRGEIQSQAEALGTAPSFVKIAKVLARNPAEPRDWRLRRKSGEVRSHSMVLTPMTDEAGAVAGYVLTSEDVTARVQRQESLLAALLSEREAVERLEQADRMKDALVSTVSHELRTPLTSILGYATMLADGDFGDLDGPAEQMLDRIIKNGERLRSLVEDLLVLARVNAGHLEVDAHVLDLRDVVRSAQEVVVPSLVARDLDVRIRLPEGPALVDGDAGMLERVLLNLLTNALKFTPDGGRVDVVVGVEDEEVVMDVSDTGLGIPLEEQDQLFTQFFRSSVAKKEAIQGTGLGLSIAHSIVEQHGGVIGATSEAGAGSTFLVVLPRLTEAAATARGWTPTEVDPSAPGPETVGGLPTPYERSGARRA